MSEIRWYPAGTEAPQTVLLCPCGKCVAGQEAFNVLSLKASCQKISHCILELIVS